MTSFTIAGNKDNIKSILSSTLLDILSETRIALDELHIDFNNTDKNDTNTNQCNTNNSQEAQQQNISTIYSLKHIDTNKLCSFIYTNFFKNIYFYISKNALSNLNNNSNIPLFNFPNNNTDNKSILFDEIKCFKQVVPIFIINFIDNIDDKLNIDSFTEELDIIGDNILDTLDESIENILYGVTRIFKDIRNSLQPIINKFLPTIVDDFINFNISPSYIDSYMIAMQQYHNTIFNNNDLTKELTMGNLTLYAIEKYMQDNKLNLQETLKLFFPTINDTNMLEINNFIKVDIKPKTTIKPNQTKDSKQSTKKSYKEHLLNNTFYIDDEYKEEIMQKIDKAFTNSNDIEITTAQAFNKLENILIKNNDYSTYTDREKEIVESLKNIYMVLNKAIYSLHTTLNDDKANESPRAKRRNYLRAIQEYNEAINSLHKVKTQINKPIGNPFLDPKLNPRIND